MQQWRVEVTWQGWVYVEAPAAPEAGMVAVAVVEDAMSEWRGEASPAAAEPVEDE